MIYVPGIDLDIPDEAAAMPLQQAPVRPAPRMRPEDTAHIDLRIKPESRPRALKHLAVIRERLSKPKAQSVNQQPKDLSRKLDLFRQLSPEVTGQLAKKLGAA